MRVAYNWVIAQYLYFFLSIKAFYLIFYISYPLWYSHVPWLGGGSGSERVYVAVFHYALIPILYSVISQRIGRDKNPFVIAFGVNGVGKIMHIDSKDLGRGTCEKVTGITFERVSKPERESNPDFWL